MAQSIEEIKASLEAPTHIVVDGVQVDLTAEEIETTLNTWADNERAKQLDEEANGYKTARVYPQLGEQFDKLWHDINNGTLDNTGEFFTALQEVKDNNPKLGA